MMGVPSTVADDSHPSYFSDEFSALEEVMRRKSDPDYEGMISRAVPTGYGDFQVVSLPIETVLDNLINDSSIQVQDPFYLHKSQF